MPFDSSDRYHEKEYVDEDFTPRGLADDDDDDDGDHDVGGDDDGDSEMEDEADFQSHYSERHSSSVSTSSDEDLHERATANGENVMGPSAFLSNTSLPNAFAPPFYNRPPTPLPPSPSLTSLLRPSFSTTTSRPTTPDSSDVENLNDMEAAVARSARTAITVPRASPKVPTYEYYGFVLYLASSLAFLTIIYIYVALSAYNTGYLTLPMSSIENIVDEVANIAVIDSKGRRRPGGSEKMNPNAATAQIMGPQKRKLEWKYIWNEGTDAVMDIPVGGVCEVLYGGADRNRHRSEHRGISGFNLGRTPAAMQLYVALCPSDLAIASADSPTHSASAAALI
ncbi:phosphatidylinositol glycan, class P [Blastomyces gilchristii SLH14081]|uniref:Phosphatidylinositol glycan, class P n=1 Tax=Blastomyces gilchristii (strain SLH14081) TaxID=559298 RepID=A0A179UGV6_BLAGS|nr:phosphatidylinositol glycan, class P [Blastomyces gilchristii SLH14081]OAT06459.1 phosphatidylinositol glycan, class P [Blastomyces gilchristii SLH14081]